MINKCDLMIFFDDFFSVEKNSLKKYIKDIIKDIDIRFEKIYFYFVNGKEIQRINKVFLSHNFETDIITFNYSDEAPFKAEIYICYSIANINAKKYGVNLQLEIFRLIIHGILHIKGYNDATRSEKKEMKNLEDKYLKKNANKFKELKIKFKEL